MFEPKFVNPTRDVWLEERKKYVTATQVASILGVNKFMSGEQLRQQFYLPDDVDQNSPYLLAGHKWEPKILEDASKMLDGNIKYTQAFYTLDEHMIAATPDAVLDSGILIEAKATNYNNYKYWENHPPLNYLAQVHTQLLTTNARHAYIAGMFFMNWPEEPVPISLSVYKIDRSPEVEKKILDSVDKFWYALEHDEPFKSKNLKDIRAALIATATKIGGQGYMEVKYVLDDKQMIIMRQTMFKAALKKGIPVQDLDREFHKLMDVVQDGSRDTLIMVGAIINAWADSDLPLEAFNKVAKEGLLYILTKGD